MTIFIGAQFKKSDRQRNIDKYRVSAHKVYKISQKSKSVIHCDIKILQMDILTFLDLNLILCILHIALKLLFLRIIISTTMVIGQLF